MNQIPLYINGQWQKSDETFTVTDPGNGETIANVAAIDAAGTGQAIDHAQSALQSWRESLPRDRGDYLFAIVNGLQQRQQEIARAIVRENGKPLSAARAETNATIDHFRWFAEEARRIYGRVVPQQDAGKRHLVIKRPIGVCAAIAPWNFPLMLAARKVAPALAAGCTVLLRPARQTPVSAWILAQIIDEIELPAGVFQLLNGPSKPIAEAFFSHPHCRKVTFTGSTGVGQALIRQSADTVTNLSLELGGHAPVLIFPDADLETAVQGTLGAKFRNTGQSCIAANRIYVHRDLHDRFVDRFVSEVEAMRVGYGLDEGVDIGPMVNREAMEGAIAQIDDATDRGATIRCGGKALDIPGGAYLAPTVLSELHADSVCLREETFAPIAPILPFDDEAEAIRLANDTRYGLAAYAFTNDLSRAWRLGEELDAGTVAINDSVPSTSQCPFGGTKQSGLGRELGSEGIEPYLETKHISLGHID